MISVNFSYFTTVRDNTFPFSIFSVFLRSASPEAKDADFGLPRPLQHGLGQELSIGGHLWMKNGKVLRHTETCENMSEEEYGETICGNFSVDKTNKTHKHAV